MLDIPKGNQYLDLSILYQYTVTLLHIMYKEIKSNFRKIETKILKYKQKMFNQNIQNASNIYSNTTKPFENKQYSTSIIGIELSF